MIERSDITISVWNQFWSPELIQGLLKSEYSLQLIGTSRVGEDIVSERICYLSKALLKLFLKTNQVWFRKASMDMFELESFQHKRSTRCLWAWSGFNLKLIRWAKEHGIPVIVDTGGAHKGHFWRELREEHRQWNIPLPERDSEGRSEKALAEYALADKIVMPSNFVKRTFIQEGVAEDKLVVNPYGVASHFWSDAASAPERRPDGKFIVIYGAGITLRKGIHYLIRAWKRANLINSELWICGVGSLSLGQLCEGIPSSVKFLGYQTHVQMRDLYRHVHLYALPSMLEGLARSCIEAMAAGLPLLITEETGVTDHMTNGREGWVIPCRAEDPLLERLLWCHRNRQAVAEAGRAAALVGSVLTFEAYGQRSSDLIASVVGKPGEL